MMAKQYKFMRVDIETVNNFNIKAKKLNDELRKLGLPPKIKTIDVTKMASRKPLYLDVKEIVRMSKKRLKEI